MKFKTQIKSVLITLFVILLLVLCNVLFLHSFNNSSTKLSVGKKMPDSSKSLNHENTSIENEYAEVIQANLKISSLNMNIPILSDFSENLSQTLLCKLFGSNPNEIGNYVIAGATQNYDKLSSLSVGDNLELEDSHGNLVKYSIYDKYLAPSDDIKSTSQLTNGKKEITIITTEDDKGYQKLIVKGVAI